MLLAFMGSAYAAEDGEDVEGMNGMLNVLGTLHETPCSLEMTSLHQTVELGAVTTSQLQRPGDQATSVAFQPVLSVAFMAPADADDPRLVKVQGITGMGLRLTDDLGRDVQLGSRGQPLFLTLGKDTQTWNVQPTRTSAPLSSGAFKAVVDFRLNYE